MIKLSKPLVLASASPRRKELLELCGVEFEVIAAVGEESAQADDPARLVSLLAEQKAQEVAQALNRDALVLGADTVVCCAGRVLGKPKTREEAVQMLTLISGREHQVYTGVCVADCLSKRKKTSVAQTKVRIQSMSRQEILEYADTGESMDKAGAYAVQGRFAPYVESISGCFYNVMGLPLNLAKNILESF